MATSKKPGQNRIRQALARIYDEQTPYFGEYLRRYKEDPKSRVFAPLAEAYRRTGKIKEAIQICLDGLKYHPDFAGGRVALAKCYFDKKEFKKAKEQLERVIEQVPENLLAQRLLGDTCLALKDHPSALDAYKMALLLAPTDVKLAQKVKQLETESFEGPGESLLESEGTQEEEPSFIAETNELPSTAPDEPVAEDMIPVVTDTGKVELVAFDEEQNLSSVDKFLGIEEGDDEEDAFQVESVQGVFKEPARDAEINTETLGDLYFAQGQFDRCLRIFEKIQESNNTPEIRQKIDAARAKLGVLDEVDGREKKIEMLKGILDKLQDAKGTPRA